MTFAFSNKAKNLKLKSTLAIGTFVTILGLAACDNANQNTEQSPAKVSIDNEQTDQTHANHEHTDEHPTQATDTKSSSNTTEDTLEAIEKAQSTLTSNAEKTELDNMNNSNLSAEAIAMEALAMADDVQE